MPELPEVETIVRGLAARLRGFKIESAEVLLPKLVQGDAAGFAQALAGRTIQGFRRRGKLILVDLGDLFWAVHLKMTGKFSFASPEEPLAKHVHARLAFEKAGFELRYQDLRQFGWFRLVRPEELDSWDHLKSLGPDALEIDPARFAEALDRRRGRLKPLLLDQSLVAGLGNIYVDEALFRAGLHPRRPAQSLKPAEKKLLHRAMLEVLEEAIAAGGSSIATYRDVEGNLGYFQTRHRVYHREGQPCPLCQTAIQKERIGGRSSHFCPRCQKI